MTARHFDTFKDTVDRELMRHPVVTDNAYTAWFAEGRVPLDHLRRFTVQFSVFSNQFLLAALNRVINAGTLEAARESKEILLNELGVIYADGGRGADGRGGRAHAGASPADADREGDPALVSTTGTVDGGTFRFRAAHFEWLLRFGAALGLGFPDMGQRRHGDPSTLFFCDELFRLYGSADYNEAMGASFAVENWAAAGFWKELIRGLERVKAERVPALPLAFFTWHDRLEENHREHVWHELRACHDSPAFEGDAFIAAGSRCSTRWGRSGTASTTRDPGTRGKTCWRPRKGRGRDGRNQTVRFPCPSTPRSCPAGASRARPARRPSAS